MMIGKIRNLILLIVMIHLPVACDYTHQSEETASVKINLGGDTSGYIDTKSAPDGLLNFKININIAGELYFTENYPTDTTNVTLEVPAENSVEIEIFAETEYERYRGADIRDYTAGGTYNVQIEMAFYEFIPL